MDTGLSAATRIGRHVSIGAGSLLRSAVVEAESVIGPRCILLEGSVVESQSVLAGGTLVPPGRIIPRGQLWSGSPAQFVRNLTADEVAELPKIAEKIRDDAALHAAQARAHWLSHSGRGCGCGSDSNRPAQELPHGAAYSEAEAVRATLGAVQAARAAARKEVVAIWESAYGLAGEDQFGWAAAFKAMDKNGDGYLDQARAGGLRWSGGGAAADSAPADSAWPARRRR